MSSKSSTLFLVVLLVVVLLVGSAFVPQPQDPANPPAGAFQPDHVDQSINVAGDGSESFVKWIKTVDSKGFKFFVNALDKIHGQRRASQHDRLTVAMIDGAQYPIRWQGSLREVRVSFDSLTAFHSALLHNLNPHGSRVFDSSSELIEHAFRHRGVNAKTRFLVLILSDLDDNMGRPGSKERLKENLKNLADRGGSVGFYWVSQQNLPEWNDYVHRLFGDRGVVFDKSEATPKLPNF